MATFVSLPDLEIMMSHEKVKRAVVRVRAITEKALDEEAAGRTPSAVMLCILCLREIATALEALNAAKANGVPT